ncbi:hypothetical protein Hanom_Chr05g00406951 [Helianthus anomalus]|nr:hypothetical protein HanIR_Chr05g0216001 [Helianthus annuus]
MYPLVDPNKSQLIDIRVNRKVRFIRLLQLRHPTCTFKPLSNSSSCVCRKSRRQYRHPEV